MEPSKFLINGEWCVSEKKRAVVNPFHGRPIGEVYQATSAQIESAMEGATAAFEHTRHLSSYERASALSSISREIETHKERFAQTITAETGKPISLSRSEVDRSVYTFRVASEEASRMEGSIIPLDVAPGSERRMALVRRFPLGPIAAITPFNFPLNLVAHKVGPAIAAGCPIVLKPSSNAPLTALLLAEVIDRTSLPKGSLSVVPCLSGEAEQLVTDDRLKLITFTGSPVVGWGIKARAGKKRVVLELGGNAGVIIGRDANVEVALKKIIQGAFGNAGQSCISVQRIFAHSSIYDAFLARLVTLAQGVAVGDPEQDGTLVGPMIDENAAKNVESWINEAVAGGAMIRCGGTRSGAVMMPTVVTEADPSMNISCREVFAPLVVVYKFTDFKDAVAGVNNSVFGLQASVFTNDAADMFYAYNELQVGGVIMNDSSSYRMDHMPYGGVKDSGFGREGVRYAIEEMTEPKLLALNFS